MLTINPWLTLVGLVTMPLGGFISAKIIGYSQKFFRGQQKALGSLDGFIEEIYNGHSVVKAFGREEKNGERFKKYNDELYGHSWKAQFCSGIMMPVIMFLTNVGYVFISVLGGWLVIAGRLMIGDIQAMIQYMRQFSQPMSMLANIVNVLQSAVAASDRIFELLDEWDEEPINQTP
jgi:ATP-binding cassette subfamily B protein